jgi:hypothetical protein
MNQATEFQRPTEPISYFQCPDSEASRVSRTSRGFSQKGSNPFNYLRGKRNSIVGDLYSDEISGRIARCTLFICSSSLIPINPFKCYFYMTFTYPFICCLFLIPIYCLQIFLLCDAIFSLTGIRLLISSL